MRDHTTSQRRVCDIVGVHPKTVRRERPPDHADTRNKTHEISEKRRRFDYRRIGVMLERDGFTMNENKLYRLYKEEGLSVRRRRGRKRARGTRAPLPIPNRPNARCSLDWKIENHAEGIELYGKAREFMPWPEWLVNTEAPETVQTAAELILGTGQRPAAAVSMRHDQFAGDLMMVTDEKGGLTFEVYCPQPLRAYLATRPRRGAHVLPKNLTQPLGYSAVEKAFSAWRATMGDKAKPFTLHGLRKLAIVRLAEAGCTDAQIQAITNQSPEMVAYYRKHANRKVLSRAGHKLAEQNKTET